MTQPSQQGKIVEVDNCRIDLKNPYIAAVLAFVIPGAGHFYQGRLHKAYLYTVSILGLFFLGLFIGNGRVVYMAWGSEDFRLQFPAQLCVGLPAFPALVQGMMQEKNPNVAQNRPQGRAKAGPAPWSWKKFMAPPEDLDELSQWHLEGSAGFELGTLFTAVAGLLNVLAIFDAFSGPMPIPPPHDRKKKQPATT